MIEQQNIIYYEDPDLLQRDIKSTRPLRVVFLTSIRDTGTCDRNGTWVMTDDGSEQYMTGAVERTVRETYPGGRLANLIRVVGVVTDDTDKDMLSSSYSILPGRSPDWIHQLTLATPDGQLVRNMTYNIPSTFRQCRRSAKGERRQLKYEFEEIVLQRMRELRGDILISDHYMARIDHLYRLPSLFGKVLNIHPAITVEDHPHCNRGPTPTANSIRNAREGKYTITGATLHFVGPIIDGGQPIAHAEGTPVYPTDGEQWLRYRNYTGAKLPLFVHGLAYYARSIYPYLNELDDNDLNKMEKINPPLPQYLIDRNERTHAYESVLFS